MQKNLAANLYVWSSKDPPVKSTLQTKDAQQVILVYLFYDAVSS
jgi:hypothetical protein